MKLFHVIATSVLGTAMALGTGFALANKQNERQAKAIDTDEYNISSTALKTLANGKQVVWGPSTSNLATATSGSNWIETSNSSSDWAIYDIIKENDSFYLKTGSTYVYSSAAKKITLDSENKTPITLDSDGAVEASSIGVFAYNSAGGIRPYSSLGSLESTYLYEVTETSPKKTMTIKDSESVASSSYNVNYSVSGSFFYAYEGENEISPSWASSNESVFTVEKVDKHAWIKGTGAGTANLTATLDGYKTTSVAITINLGTVSSISVSGSMTKTDYTTLDSWSPDGLTVTANYSTGFSGAVTSGISWSYVPTKPADGVTSVVATATYSDKSASSTAQAVTVTVANDGSQEHPYSVSEALAASAQNNVYVSGIISKIDEVSTSFGNATYYISDDGTTATQIKVFRGKYLNNASFTDASQIAVGDTVTIYGNITVYSNVNQLAQGNYLTSLDHHELETINTIQGIYAGVDGQSVDVYGYYVDLMDNKNMIVMDGDYGIDIYQSSDFDVTGYEANTTVLHLVGKISIYSGLYELVNTTVTVITDESVIAGLGISKPVVYATKGGETAEYANRITTVTGVVTALNVASYTWDGTKDVTITVTIGSKTVDVFYKKAAQNTTDGGKIDASLANETEITFKGFTNWHDGFQVRMTGLVDAVESYTAEMFAQDLLDQTDAVCTGYQEGDNNHDDIEAIWSDLASSDKYPSLPAAQKAILAAAEADEHSSDIVEQAMARYDYLTVRYNLNNFINGRLGGSESNRINNSISNNNTLMIVIIASTITIVSLAGLFFIIRKRKHQ